MVRIKGKPTRRWPVIIGIFFWLFLVSTPVRAASFSDDSFARAWQRADLPVSQGTAARSFMWGPGPFKSGFETYWEAPDGSRLVQYFDKARMEITQPGADPASASYVTNGLLVRELISGAVQLGDNRFSQRQPANVPVAGDPLQDNPDGPVYASFKEVASLNNDNRAPDLVGQEVSATLTKDGTTGFEPELAGLTRVAYYSPELGHNIPEVFWEFMQATGLVYNGSALKEEKVVDWVPAMGLPLTEAYWTRVMVGGEEKDVLVQAFERRILTFTPSNPPQFQVEMGNVGQHYALWRYGYLSELRVDAPEDGAVVLSNTVTLNGHLSALRAVLTLNDEMVEPDSEGDFEQEVTLIPGLNLIEVISSTGSDNELEVIRVIYQP